MDEIKILNDRATALKVGDFLVGPNAFAQTWAPKEKEIIRRATLESLAKDHHRYWYVEQDGQIIAADIDSYKPARAFYEKHGYEKVAEIPDYYVKGEGRIDYFKSMA